MIEPGAIVVLTTFGDRETADRVARTLVDEGLVACAQISTQPIRSLYRWKGTVVDEEEYGLSLKTTETRLEAVSSRLRALHPYEVPEFLVLGARASGDYAAWLRASTLEPPDRPQA